MPSALDLAMAGKEEENIANEIHQEEVTRRRQLYFWIAVFILILIAIIAVIVVALHPWKK